MSAETDLRVTRLKQVICTAVAISIIRKCRDGTDPKDYARNLQISYFSKIDDPDVINKSLPLWQEEAKTVIKETLLPCLSVGTDGDHESENSKAGNLCESSANYNFRYKTHEGLTARTSVVPHKRSRSMEDGALKYAKFMESIMILIEFCAQNSAVPKSVLHATLIDDADCTSKLFSSCITNKNEMTEDSGVGYSEGCTEDSLNIKFVSSELVKCALDKTKSRDLVAISLKALVNCLKNSLSSECEFFEWKGPAHEHICNIIRQCSQIDFECRDIVMDFVVEVIGECWANYRPCNHISSEKKIIIIDNLIADIYICYEVLQNIREKLAVFNTCLCKNHPAVPNLAEKVIIFLELYCSTSEKIKELLSEKGSVQNNIKPEYENVSELWMAHRLPNDTDSDLTPIIVDRDIEVLEALSVSTSSRYPFTGMLILEALNSVIGLKELISNKGPDQSLYSP